MSTGCTHGPAYTVVRCDQCIINDLRKELSLSSERVAELERAGNLLISKLKEEFGNAGQRYYSLNEFQAERFQAALSRQVCKHIPFIGAKGEPHCQMCGLNLLSTQDYYVNDKGEPICTAHMSNRRCECPKCVSSNEGELDELLDGMQAEIEAPYPKDKKGRSDGNG